MGKIVIRNQPCLECNSSDGRQVYEDGSSFCFSCRKSFKKNVKDASFIHVKKKPYKSIPSLKDIESYFSNSLDNRFISKEVCSFFGVKVSYNDSGKVDAHYYPYGKNAYKVRELPKKFYWINKSSSLFGQDKFNKSGKRLIITEGEIDTLSVAEAAYKKYKRIYPVVGLSSSAMATKTLLKERDWVRSFKEVVLVFDEDEAGEKAKAEAVRIIGIDKVRIAKLPLNDANLVLEKKGAKALLNLVFEASPYVPSGIITKEELKKQMHSLGKEPSVPYPPCLNGINTKLKGMRLGEIALYISGTGSGKSTMVRENILHLLKITEDKIGVISLEETPGETARSMSAMQLRRNLAYEEISEKDLDRGFDEVFDSNRVIVLDHQGSIKDETIVDQMEYMALMGCKYLFIDHITILVSEGASELRGNEAIDKIMNDLLRIVKKHRVHIGLVSHLRKTPSGTKSYEEGQMPTLDAIKGSGSIKQVSLDIIAFARNMTHKDESVRNFIKMSVLKCRATGLTGPVNGAHYDFKTGRLIAQEEGFEVVEEQEDFVKL